MNKVLKKWPIRFSKLWPNFWNRLGTNLSAKIFWWHIMSSMMTTTQRIAQRRTQKNVTRHICHISGKNVTLSLTKIFFLTCDVFCRILPDKLHILAPPVQNVFWTGRNVTIPGTETSFSLPLSDLSLYRDSIRVFGGQGVSKDVFWELWGTKCVKRRIIHFLSAVLDTRHFLNPLEEGQNFCPLFRHQFSKNRPSCGGVLGTFIQSRDDAK